MSWVIPRMYQFILYCDGTFPFKSQELTNLKEEDFLKFSGYLLDFFKLYSAKINFCNS